MSILHDTLLSSIKLPPENSKHCKCKWDSYAYQFLEQVFERLISTTTSWRGRQGLLGSNLFDFNLLMLCWCKVDTISLALSLLMHHFLIYRIHVVYYGWLLGLNDGRRTISAANMLNNSFDVQVWLHAWWCSAWFEDVATKILQCF